MRTRRGPRVKVDALVAALKLEVRRAGNEYRGHCPNPTHARRPGPGSWQIQASGPKEGLHICYACGFGGGPIVLVKTVLGLTTDQEARSWLRSLTGEIVPAGAAVIQRFKVPPRVEVPELRVPEGTLALWVASTDPTVEKATRYLAGEG